MTGIPALTCDNETGRQGAGHTKATLTQPDSDRRAPVSLAKICTIEDCETAVLARGWCGKHYARWRQHGDPIANGGRTVRADTCTVSGCEKPHKARGFCPKHWEKWNRHGDPLYVRPKSICKIEDCGRPTDARGWCFMHYQRWSKHGDPNLGALNRRDPICDLPGCDKPSPAQAYCPMHFERLKRNGHFGRQIRIRHGHSDGYVFIKCDEHPLANSAGWLYEHRAVLYARIGPGAHPCHWCGTSVTWDHSYPAYRDALVVDHVDDVKDNNSPENLVPSCQVCNSTRSGRWVKPKKRRENA